MAAILHGGEPMLMEIDKCEACGKLFTFNTSQCGQIILRQGQPDALIIFLPRCPYCSCINMVELPWKKYGTIDY